MAVSEGVEYLVTYKLLLNLYFEESTTDDLKMDTLLFLIHDFETQAYLQKRYNAQGHCMLIRVSAHKNRNELTEVVKLAPNYLTFLSKHEEKYIRECIEIIKNNWKLQELLQSHNTPLSSHNKATN